MGLKKRKKKKTQHNTTPIYTIAKIITFHYCVCKRERERERGGCCVASLKKNLRCILLLFFLIYVIDLQENRCTTFRVCTIGRLKVKENEKMSPPKYFLLSLMLTPLASSKIKFMYFSKPCKA